MSTNTSSSAEATAAEAKELALVSKVELRIALTDSDAKLEAILKTYLPPLLLKLASEHVNVRNKVISILQHVNTRVKPPYADLSFPSFHCILLGISFSVLADNLIHLGLSSFL